jgi:hypothetical protein
LNYDRSIEELALRAGFTVDTGIAHWPGGYDWEWDARADVQLLKLHGSADWRLIDEVGPGRMPEKRIKQVDLADHAEPALVFGARGKLRSEGPFLAMLRAFDDFVRNADRLLLVGYSMRDQHINTAIYRWLNARPDGRLTVINPDWESLPSKWGEPRTMADDLLRAIESPRGPGIGDAWNPRFRVVELPASEGLAAVLGAGPSLASAND